MMLVLQHAFIQEVFVLVVTTVSTTTSTTVTTSRDPETTSTLTGGHDTVSSPVTETSLYVSSQTGADTNDGLSVDTALKTLKKAASKAGSRSRIYVMEGEYNNNNFGGGMNNGAVMTIKGLQTKPGI